MIMNEWIDSQPTTRRGLLHIDDRLSRVPEKEREMKGLEPAASDHRIAMKKAPSDKSLAIS